MYPGDTISKMSAEFLGSMFLVIAAISPIILFTEVLNADIALAVAADALSVGFVLFALIEVFSPVSGAHFNPAVTLAFVMKGEMKIGEGVRYSASQLIGGFTGTVLSHLMFIHESGPVLEISSVTRDGGTFAAEIIGTFFLVLAILILVHQGSRRVSLIVGFLVGGMLLATSSTMFANPQVTIARIFTHSDAGISPVNGLFFIVMEITGALLAFIVWKVIFSKSSKGEAS